MMKLNFVLMLFYTTSLFSKRLFQAPYKSLIQYRRFHIPSSSIQTKEWRQQQPWYKGGKHNECELYQKPLIEKIVNEPLQKSNDRIHSIFYNIKSIKHPMKHVDGLEWTENFDAYIDYKNKDLYFNLKIICDNGGAQTRSIRETYNFMKYQMEHIKKYQSEFSKEKYFINILDGNTCNRNMNNFYYLLNKPEYTFQKPYVFVGDMKQFQEYWYKIK